MHPSLPRFLLLLAFWFVAATVAGACHLFEHLPPLAIPVVIASLSIGFSLSVTRIGWMKSAATAIGIRTILAAHLIRFVGFYFLWLHGQDRLPVEFAQRAGWGDIIAAAGALLFLAWPEGARFRRALLAWNIFGTADLLLAVGTGGWLNTTRPGSMIELAGLPLALVPLFLVPVLLTSHIHLAIRLSQSRDHTGLPTQPART